MRRRTRSRGGASHLRRAVRFLEPTLLLLLHQRPAHGYTLLDRIREFGLGGDSPSIVYRTLRDMEDQGWVTSTWDSERTQGPPRRVYRLTGEGDKTLSSWMQELQRTRGQIDHLVDVYNQHMDEGQGEHHAR